MAVNFQYLIVTLCEINEMGDPYGMLWPQARLVTAYGMHTAEIPWAIDCM